VVEQFPQSHASFENSFVEALRERRAEGFFGRNPRQPGNKMVEAALSDVVKARRSSLRLREIETRDCAALTPRDEIEPARGFEIAAPRTSAAAKCPTQYSGDPQHSLVEQTSQVCEVTCSEASRPDGRPFQPYFESWVKRGDLGYSS
jgi:hypothetical protein